MKSNVPETDLPRPWGNGLVRVSKTCPWKVGLFLFFFHKEIFSLNLIIEHLKVVVNQNENLELNLCLTYLIFVIFFVLDKGPYGSKVLARYVSDYSSIKAEKEH